MQVLASQAAIRRAIREVMDPMHGRRVAVVAFVGKGANAYIGDPEGAEIICWPRAGGTNPEAVRELMERGARVSFADRLHMKLYWSRAGAVIGSPNLSTNALGAGDLRELAVRVPAGSVNIRAILASVGARLVDRAALARLEREQAAYDRTHGRRAVVSPGADFGAWTSRGARRERWRLTWCDHGDGVVSMRARAASRRLGGDGDVHDLIHCRAGDLSQESWVLVGQTTRGGSLTALTWLYVHRIVKVDRSDRRAFNEAYPCQAIQVFPPRMCPPPPFMIDPAFRKALRAWRDEIGAGAFEKRVLGDMTCKVSAGMADALYRHYRRVARRLAQGSR